MNSSRLLIDESPLQVLPSLACAVGLNEAIFVQQLHYWLRSKYAKEHDDKPWVYNTYEGWHEQFPFWSYDTVRRVITACEKQGLIETTTRFNHRSGDRTKWYTVNYAKLAETEGVDAEPPAKTTEQHGNLPSATLQSAPTQHGNLPSALPEKTQRKQTETTTEAVEGPDADSPDDPLPDDETGQCLLLLNGIRGFPKDDATNARKLAEYRARYPAADPVEVCRDFADFISESPFHKGDKPRLRLRNFFKQADKPRANGNSPPQGNPASVGPTRGGKNYDWWFGDD